MKALLLSPALKTATVTHLPLPLPPPQLPSHLLLRTSHIALNPVDALYTLHPLASPTDPPRTDVGSDFSGTVLPPSSHPSLPPGTLVAGFLQGASSSNPLPGAFAEYITVESDLVWRVPRGMSAAQAAGVSLCGLTAAQMVVWRLGMPAAFGYVPSGGTDVRAAGVWEGKDEVTVFVYGASTSVGIYAAQLVRRGFEAAGRRVRLIGAAGRGRWGVLRGGTYGYEELVDYKDEGWVGRVRGFTEEGRGVDFALDCVSEGVTVRMVSETLGEGGKVAIVRSREGGAWRTEGVPMEKVVYGAVWEGLGKEVGYTGFVVPASAEARAFAAAFYRWLSEGRNLEPSPVRLMPGGLERVVEDGFALLGAGTMEDRVSREEEWMKPVHGEKLVYQIHA
ncbi:hypothetical protein QBC39DRAFT_400858 [Podospora conica]|nr:hypothetical protein QBC39DRAFT_400858 [Schizothecium conicum]